ncbi:hypothetical protein BGX20_002222 [Mortierella sp. AD010]|nr:hypothetical protein BGX20_002222 [Mortierella sp. AD010]
MNPNVTVMFLVEVDPTPKVIALPSDISDLKTFLQSNSLLTLFAFRHLRRSAIDATDTLAQSKATSSVILVMKW